MGLEVAQVGAELRHELLRFLEEDRQELRSMSSRITRFSRPVSPSPPAFSLHLPGFRLLRLGSGSGCASIRAIRARSFFHPSLHPRPAPASPQPLDHPAQLGDRRLITSPSPAHRARREAGPLLEHAGEIGERREAGVRELLASVCAARTELVRGVGAGHLPPFAHWT